MPNNYGDLNQKFDRLAAGRANTSTKSVTYGSPNKTTNNTNSNTTGRISSKYTADNISKLLQKDYAWK